MAAAKSALPPVVALLLAAGCVCAEEEAPAAPGCTITAKSCPNFPQYSRGQFRDALGEKHLSTGNNEAACLKRAEDFHHWCGLGSSDGAQVGATFNGKKLSQLYHPSACDAGWSQWDAFCYKHYWEKMNWFDAERLCRERGAHLASVHSQEENRFIFSLTRGLSAWIGYTDLDQDTHYKWSDDTQDDFSNFAKNCTGREHEPDCKPEERQQQWYDWEGGDRGTFVCKRNALLPVALLRNTTAAALASTAWGLLLPGLPGGDEKTPPGEAGAAAGTAALPALKTQDLPVPKDVDGSSAGPAAKTILEPRLGVPKGTLR